MVESDEWYTLQDGKCFPLKEKLSTSGEGKFQTEEELTNLLLNNPELIEPGLLLLRSDPKGVGGIDILGLSSKGRFVVVEIKRGSINASSFGQCLGYALAVR